jgi:hypothetical protein
LYEHREKIRSELPAQERVRKGSPCSDVSAADIFDYCFPSGIDLADSEQTKAQSAFASHALSCPSCLARVQHCHRTICDIAERSRSELTSCFDFEDLAGEAAESELDELYADWPIKVQLLEESASTPHVVPFAERLIQGAKRRNLQQYVKPAAAAAAILIACVLFFSTPVVKAVDLSQIYEAIGKVKNVSLSRFAGNGSEAGQKVWISQTLNIKVYRTKEQVSVKDVANGVLTTKSLSSGSVTTTAVPVDILAKWQASMKVPSFGLMPFSSISAVPEGAEWHRVHDVGANAVLSETEVYDLKWTEPLLGQITEYHRWRFFVDPDTNLPMRIEMYIKSKVEVGDEYILDSAVVVEYPSDQELQSLLEGLLD